MIEKTMKGLAPQVGLEPTTLRLTAGCSTIELLRISAASSIVADDALRCQSGVDFRNPPPLPHVSSGYLEENLPP